MRPLVLVGLVDKILAFVVLASEIKFTLLQKVVDAILLSLAHRIENRRLAIIIHMVRIASFLNKHLHYISMPFSSRIENRRLPIAVHMICFASILQEELA